MIQKNKAISHATLPQKSFSYFWDTQPSSLDIRKDCSFIVRRLLEWGDLEEVRWLLKTYSLKDLKRELKSCRSLSPKSASFWAILLDTSLGELPCIRNRSSRQLKTAWPY